MLACTWKPGQIHSEISRPPFQTILAQKKLRTERGDSGTLDHRAGCRRVICISLSRIDAWIPVEVLEINDVI